MKINHLLSKSISHALARNPFLFFNSKPRLSRLWLIVIVLLGMFWLNRVSHDKARAQSAVFTFTAAGDYGASSNARTVLDHMANQNAAFSIALGDFSYNDLTPESNWCDFIKYSDHPTNSVSRFGANFPFQLIAGNHESGEDVGGLIQNFATCLPDQLGSTGEYGKEYIFDYPSVLPLARFILISADLSFPDTGAYSYTVGSTRYNWVASTIDAARAAGIKWVVVGVHKDCISIGSKGCEIGQELFDLLLQKKVDLILQGHDHVYLRSKQLTCGPRNTFNPDCVVPGWEDNVFEKDAGSVVIIAGTGGRGLSSVNATDSEAGYFAASMGGNSNPSNGYMKFSVSETNLAAEFISAVGSYSDSFTIGPSGASPMPSGAASPSPTPGAVSILNPVADTYVRSNKATTNYGTAVDLISSSYSGSNIQKTFMKFDLSAFAGLTLTQVQLRFTPNLARTVNKQVKLISDISWTETGLNWNNQPTMGSVLGTLPTQAVTVGIPVTITLDPIQLQPYVGSTLGIGIDNAVGASTFAVYSRNSTIGKPELIVTVSGTGGSPIPTSTPSPSLTPSPSPLPSPSPSPIPSPTPVSSMVPSPTPSGVSTINPTVDAMVKSGYSNSNYGGVANIAASTYSSSNIMRAFMKFDLTQFAGSTFASISLKVTPNAARTVQKQVKLVPSTSWLENTITWNNQPGLGAIIGNLATQAVTVGNPVTISLDAAQLQPYAGGLVSIVLDNTTQVSTFDVSSKEAASGKPELTITLQ